MKSDYMFTSESVTEGHPDKLCDQISDAIVDHFLSQQPYSRISAECAVSGGVVFISTHYASSAKVDVCEVARNIIGQAGYLEGEFNHHDCTLMSSINELPDTYRLSDDELLSDRLDSWVVHHQSSVFGYACRHTRALMPLPIWLAHKIARRLANARLNRHMPYLLPDGKVQVGVEFRDRRPHRIHSIALINSQQAPGIAESRLRDDIHAYVLDPAFINEPLCPDGRTRLFINPNGPMIGGGPAIHAGLTGRKNAVDTYGEFSRHSGAALSGKDPLRIDRVGAYAARHAAKNIVAADLADECEVQLSYTIGLAEPTSVHVETFGTGREGDDKIQEALTRVCDFRLGAIIRKFDLCHLPARRNGCFYRLLATYGHVGRMDIGLPWERTDLIEQLRLR